MTLAAFCPFCILQPIALQHSCHHKESATKDWTLPAATTEEIELYRSDWLLFTGFCDHSDRNLAFKINIY